MTGQGEPDKARLDGLMYRMLAGLLLLGAGVLLLLTMLLLVLPRTDTAGGVLVLLPGTRERHGISTTAVPVLGAATLALGIPGLLALALGRRGVRFGRVDSPRPGPRSLLRPGLILVAGVALLLLVVLRR